MNGYTRNDMALLGEKLCNNPRNQVGQILRATGGSSKTLKEIVKGLEKYKKEFIDDEIEYTKSNIIKLK